MNCEKGNYSYTNSYTSFLDFLKKNRCCEEYMQNSDECVRRIAPKEEWVNMAFRWEPTPQGYDYWKRIDSKWRATAHSNPDIKWGVGQC